MKALHDSSIWGFEFLMFIGLWELREFSFIWAVRLAPKVPLASESGGGPTSCCGGAAFTTLCICKFEFSESESELSEFDPGSINNCCG